VALTRVPSQTRATFLRGLPSPMRLALSGAAPSFVTKQMVMLATSDSGDGRHRPLMVLVHLTR